MSHRGSATPPPPLHVPVKCAPMAAAPVARTVVLSRVAAFVRRHGVLVVRSAVAPVLLVVLYLSSDVVWVGAEVLVNSGAMVEQRSGGRRGVASRGEIQARGKKCVSAAGSVARPKDASGLHYWGNMVNEAGPRDLCIHRENKVA